MSSFGERQLLKYGWSKGKGLGKNENGIAQALRPKLKFNNEGLGYNQFQGSEWWQTIFDEASKNIVVHDNEQKKEIKFSNCKQNSAADKAGIMKLKSKQTRQKQYNNFRKIGLLDPSKPITSKKLEDEEKEKELEKASKEIPVLTDDELFQACEGRTVHKGARHGLTMNGKLERIRQQEQLLLSRKKHLTSKNTSETTTDKDESLSKENGFQTVKSKAKIKKEKKKKCIT